MVKNTYIMWSLDTFKAKRKFLLETIKKFVGCVWQLRNNIYKKSVLLWWEYWGGCVDIIGNIGKEMVLFVNNHVSTWYRIRSERIVYRYVLKTETYKCDS